MNLNRRQERFIEKWEKQRKKKFLYVFLNGILYRGLPLGIITYFSFIHFQTENLDILRLLLTLLLFGVVGLFYGHLHYGVEEAKYQQMNNDEEIVTGIKTLEAGNVWNYENLIISKPDAEQLIVRNELFWLDDSNATSGNLDECLNIVMKDFEYLKKHPDFDVFSSEFKVKLQIYNNSDNKQPIIEISI